MKKMLFTIAALVAFSPALLAQSSFYTTHRAHAGIEARQQYQQHRIAQGFHSGQLTAREAHRLERQQSRIERQEDRFQASGGRFTPRERARVQRELNRESRTIYRQKHDRQQRGY